MGAVLSRSSASVSSLAMMGIWIPLTGSVTVLRIVSVVEVGAST